MTQKLEIPDTIIVRRASVELRAADLDHPAWADAQPVSITRYWSGEEATEGRHAEARLIWSGAGLCVRFVCHQTEPLVVAETPQVERKTIKLWERDVCEIFIAPDASEPERYFEFEAAPTGEWLDLAIRWRPEERETDWNFASGMSASARIAENSITIAMRLPWGPIAGRAPRAGERWRANLFRCVGAGDARGYLAWRPTYTPEPGFHVPEAFGWIQFED